MKNIDLEELKKDLKNKKAIIPNILSASRMAAPFVIPPLAMTGNIPLVLLAASGFLLTDFLDGKIARALHGETKLGQLLDQISDKVCSIGLLLALIPTVPFMVVPLILESTIAAINIKNTKKGINVKSVESGRLKMWPLSISLISGYGMIMSPSIIFNIITYLGLSATTILEVINIKEYHDLASQHNEQKTNKDIKKTEIEKSQTSKEKTHSKTNTYDINEYIENCTSIENLHNIKEIIDPCQEINPKQKTKQKKRY